jgi:type VI secretion system protein ImpL
MKKPFETKEIGNFLLLVILSLAIWFSGFFSKTIHSSILSSVKFKIILISSIFVLWLIRFLIIKFLDYYTSKKVVSALIQTPEEYSAKKGEFVDQKQLQKKISLILKAIKKIKGSRKFSDLPCYVVLGQPGAGKTSALEGTNLTNPNLDEKTQHALHQVQQESTYRWWFTNEALFLEVTLSHDNKIIYAPLFDVLKKYRRGKPLDGIICVKDISSLASLDEVDLNEEFTFIKDIIGKIQKNILIPYHILFTKCDQIEGFTHYFHDLPQKDLKKTLGCYIESQNQKTIPYNFEKKFNHIIASLQACLPILFEKKDLLQRITTNNFPNQFMSLKKQFDKFISSFSKHMQANPFFFLHGIYFSSAVQNNPSIDIYPAYLKDQFSIDSNLAFHEEIIERKSYFLEDFFKEHILWASLKKPRIQKFFNWGRMKIFLSCAFYVLTTIFYIGYTQITYKNVSLYVDRISKSLDNYKNSESKNYEESLLNVKPIFKLMNENQKFYEEHLGWHQAISSLVGYSGYEAHKAIQERFIRAFDQKFWSQVFRHVEDILIKETDPEKIDVLLRCYVFFSDPSRFPQESLRSFIHEEITFHQSLEHAIKLRKYFDFGLERKIPSFSLNLELIRQKQSQINIIPLHTRVYNEIKKEAEKITPLYIYPVADPLVLHLVFDSKDQNDHVPYLYTDKGFQEFLKIHGPIIIKRIVHENQIISSVEKTAFTPLDEELLEADLWREYFYDYLNNWSCYVENLAFIPVYTLKDSVDLLDKILEKDSLFQNLLDVLEDQIKIVPENCKNNPNFMRLKKIVLSNTGTKESDSKIQEFLISLQKVQKLLVDLSKQENPNKAMFDYSLSLVKQNLKDDPLRDMAYNAQALPEPLNKWFSDLKTQIEDIIFEGAGQFINEQWEEEIVPTYNEEIALFYPVQQKALEDLKLESFTQFFGPKGLLNDFYKTYLEPFDKGRKISRLRFTKEVDEFLKNMKSFWAEFFDESNQVKLTVSLALYSLDDTLSSMTLSLFGKKLSYYHGPLQFFNLLWSAKVDCSITVSDFEGHVQKQVFEGSWGLFKLLDQYPPTSVEDGFLQTITFGKKTAQILLADNNALEFLKKMRTFRLPKELVE